MQTKLKSALYVVLVMIAGFFSSCDNSNEPMLAPEPSNTQENLPLARTRSFDDEYYHMSSDYKDDYYHVQDKHGIAAGFVATWNCISSEESLGEELTVSQVLRDLGAKPPKYTIEIKKLVETYSSSLGSDKVLKEKEDDDPVQDQFVRWLKFYWETSGNRRPICVLVRFGDSEKKNILVPVFSLKNGRIYFSNPHLGRNGDGFEESIKSMTLQSFVRHAIQASDLEGINIVYFKQ